MSTVMVGGLGAASPANEEVQKLVDHLAAEIKNQAGNQSYPHLKAISYRTQVVNGTNYVIKIDAGNEHIHVKIHKPLPVHGNEPKLSGVQTGKTLESELSHF